MMYQFGVVDKMTVYLLKVRLSFASKKQGVKNTEYIRIKAIQAKIQSDRSSRKC